MGSSLRPQPQDPRVEGPRVVRNADADRAAVVWRIVNAVGDADSAGVRAEVMIVYRDRRAVE